MMHPQNNFSRQKPSSRTYTVVGVLFVIMAMILLFSPTRAWVAGIANRVAVSLWNLEQGAKDEINAIFANFRNKQALYDEVSLLRAENHHMEALVLDRNLLAEEVTKLEESLGRVKSDNRVFAHVLGSASRSPYDTVFVDVGTNQGVAVGNKVVYAGAAGLAEVVEAGAISSKIKFYSSPGEEHGAIVFEENLPITAYGKGMGNFEAQVPAGSGVRVGDTVTSTKGGLLLGTVSLVEDKPALPFSRIYFRVPFNIMEVRTVEILKDI